MPFDPTVAKASFSCLDAPSLSISVQFNPTTFRTGRRVVWSEQPVAFQPWGTLQYGTGTCDTMSVSLLVDTSEGPESIIPDIKRFHDLTMPMRLGEEVRPPVILFVWEEYRFLGVIQSLDCEVMLFDETGRPKRATLALSLLGRAFSEAASAEEFFHQRWQL